MFERVVIDIETNNLLSPLLNYSSMPFKLKEEAKLWCVIIRCIDTDQSHIFIDPDYKDYVAPETKIIQNTITNEEGRTITLDHVVADPIGIEYNKLKKYPLCKDYLDRALKNCKEIIGHNIILFDLPMLQLFGVFDYKVGYPGTSSTIFGRDCLITDTLLWSKMLNPDRFDAFGRHALAAWGQRLGALKMDFHAFHEYSGHMIVYCNNDTLVSGHVHFALLKEKIGWKWDLPYTMESKLADLTLKQELFGLELDVDLAKWCVNDLNGRMETIRNNVNPILPPKPLNKGDQKDFTLPKKQFKADGTLSALMIKFAEKVGGEIDDDNIFHFEGRKYQLPAEGCVKETLEADVDDLNHLKAYLLELGWVPLEWKERDLTRDSKKQKLDPIKLVETIERFVENTLTGPFKDARLDLMEISKEEQLLPFLMKQAKAKGNKPIRVPVSPMIRVGTDKELCPNLLILGSKASFAKEVTEFFTYKHRKNSIAGGKEDEEGEPMTGFLSLVREDGRVATPADTLAASTSRYKHRGIVNIPRVTSLYGNHMRALFRAGTGFDQLGFDFASLEARINGHYVMPYKDGAALAATLVAEKPNDIHCFSEKTQILTQYGWKKFQELEYFHTVAQWEKGVITFVKPLSIINSKYEGDIYTFHGERFHQSVTPNHRMINKRENEYTVSLAENFDQETLNISTLPVSGTCDNFSFKYVGTQYESFIDKQALEKDGISYKTSKKNSGIMVDSPSYEFINELQTMCHLNNRLSLYSTYKGNKSVTMHRCFISKKENETVSGKHVKVTKNSYNGMIGCVTVPSGFIIIKSDNKISVSGNSVNAAKLGIDRDSAKSFSYAAMYGAQIKKLAKMLRIDFEEAERLFEAYWDAVPALKELKAKVENYWEETDKSYILGLDGRKLFARSKHSLVNLLFQGAGAMMCKWSIVYICQILEENNLLGDPLIHGKNDKKIFQMIVNHKQKIVALHSNVH